MANTRDQVVEQAVKAIRAFYRIGRSLPPKTSHRETYDTGTITAAAKKHEMNLDTMRKSRQFAASYTTTELDALCDLIREQVEQDAGQPVFGRTYVIRMLTVPKPKRRALERLAIRGAWSVATLESEIAECYGTRRDGGRPGRAPRSGTDLIMQLDGMCESWVRWQQTADPEKGQARSARLNATEVRASVTLAVLPNPIRAQLRSDMAAIGTLHAAVVRELQNHASDRSVRYQFRAKPSNPSDVKKRNSAPKR